MIWRMWTLLCCGLAYAAPPLIDVEGRTADPLAPLSTGATVLVFVRTDCPISNRYAPELRRLQERFSSRGVRFWMVYPERGAKSDLIRRHASEFQLPGRVIADPAQDLAKRSKVRVTPEAAVFSARGELVYHGRIDDRYVDFGKARPVPTRYDLEEALAAVLAGKPAKTAATKAVGCALEGLP